MEMKDINDTNIDMFEQSVRERDELIARLKEHIRRQNDERETAGENQRRAIDEQNARDRSAIQNMEQQNEDLRGRMSLKDRIKEIFKNHGFTVFAVLSAVGVVIEVIASDLKNGSHFGQPLLCELGRIIHTLIINFNCLNLWCIRHHCHVRIGGS